MKLAETRPQTVRKLHWCQEERTGAGDPMRQQIPADGFVMLPNRVRGIDEKTLIVVEHIERHRAEKGKDEKFVA